MAASPAPSDSTFASDSTSFSGSALISEAPVPPPGQVLLHGRGPAGMPFILRACQINAWMPLVHIGVNASNRTLRIIAVNERYQVEVGTENHQKKDIFHGPGSYLLAEGVVYLRVKRYNENELMALWFDFDAFTRRE